MLEGQSKL